MGLNSEISGAVNWDAPHVLATDRLESVIYKMAEFDMSSVIVKKDDIVIGLVTDMDIMDLVNRNKDISRSLVADCMTTCQLITDKGAVNPCVQLHYSESVQTALEILATAGMHNLVVAGDDEKNAGIVSAHALLRLAIS